MTSFLRNCFGANLGTGSNDLQNSINFLETPEPGQMVYPVGKHIGVRDLSNNHMKFIRQSENLKEITCLALAPNKRFLAVCERHKNDANTYLSFYDMEKNMK
jgi:hypothetical protein